MKIDKSEYEIIYNRKKNGESVMKLAKEYEVKQNTIYRIIESFEAIIDENSKLYQLKKDLEKEKNIKRIKDLAEKYDLKITINNEKDDCSVCKRLQDTILENEKRINELELELQKQSSEQIDTPDQTTMTVMLSPEVSQNNSETEFWLEKEYEENTLSILKGFKPKSRSAKVKLKLLKTIVENNDFSFQDNAPERYQIKKLVQEKDTMKRYDMLKKYSSIYHDIIKMVFNYN